MSDGGDFDGGGDGGGGGFDGGDFDRDGGFGEGEGQFTETEYTSWGDRLKGSCAGICIGLILFFGSFPLIFWNEERAVERYDALQEGESQTISVSGMGLDVSNEGKLLHFTADIVNAGDKIVDPIFGIETDGLKLSREADMYQWKENVRTQTKTTTGGKKKTTRTYSYSKEWASYLINSNSFKRSGYENPTSMRFQSDVMAADNIMIGAYQLPQDLVSRINWEVPMTVGVDDIADANLASEVSTDYNTGGYYISYYGSSSSSQPDIGDQKVSFSETPSSTITIVGVQDGNTLSAFVSESGEGGDILLFKQGNYTATEMYEAAEAENAAATWILRFVGFACMSLGLYLIFRPIEVFADVIPCVGSIVGCGIVFMAVLISAILSAITISIAWLVAHPKIGGIVLAVTLTVIACCGFGIKKLVKSKHSGGDENGSYGPTSGGKVASGHDEENGDVQIVQGAVIADKILTVQATVADEIPTVQGTEVDMTAEEKRLHDQIANQ